MNAGTGRSRVVWPRRFVLLLLIPLVLVAGGTFGYWAIEKEYTLFDSLYMTVITLTTVGYEEVHPLSTAGRVFTIVLLLGGVFTFFFTATEVVRAVVSGEVQQVFGRQRMERNLAEMKDHVIICGYGRMGRFISQEFSRNGYPFVVIDRSAENLSSLTLPHGVALPGDASDDAVLKHAGIERARALVTVAGADPDNLYITVSARLLNDKIFIVARAETEPAEIKLRRAGASRVVSPYALGGSRVAHAVLRPNVVDYLDLATGSEFYDLQIEELTVKGGSQLDGMSLKDSRMRLELGIMVVAIKKAGGGMVYNPPGDTRIEAGDTLIALGRRAEIDRLEERAGGS
jgi:voltage-gated potassium channel